MRVEKHETLTPERSAEESPDSARAVIKFQRMLLRGLFFLPFATAAVSMCVCSAPPQSLPPCLLLSHLSLPSILSIFLWFSGGRLRSAADGLRSCIMNNFVWLAVTAEAAWNSDDELVWRFNAWDAKSWKTLELLWTGAKLLRRKQSSALSYHIIY